MASYRNDGRDVPRDGRLYAPTFERNSPPMIAQLAPWLADRSGPVLEIGAGTGQHAAAFALAFPELAWWPSDRDALHLASTLAWQKALRAPDRPPLNLDAATEWAIAPAVQALGPLTAILSMNVIHISPITVAQGIIAGAGQTLASSGLLIFYGPFKENGTHTGAGNIAFDQGLRAENPDWGVRDITDITAIAQQAGLEFAALIPMPANNRLLIYRRT